MPKQTFINLPDTKRTLVINTALEEFANNAYDKASVSKIVDNAKIAKGSMYQYFENKEELYSYLVQFVSEQKLAYINNAIKAQQDNFFALYKEIIRAAAKFDLENPRYSSFLYSVGKDTRNPSISKQIMSSSISFISNLLHDAHAKGQIRDDINLDFAAFIISYLSVDIGDYISEKYDFSYADILKSKAGKLPVTDEQLSEVLDDLIEFFKRGIARNN
jgi:AcrR family transcriptional regulator